MLQEVVDVLCKNCKQLIPFGEVSKHSAECVEQTFRLNIKSTSEFERYLEEINNEVVNIQKAVQKRVYFLDHGQASQVSQSSSIYQESNRSFSRKGHS